MLALSLNPVFSCEWTLSPLPPSFVCDNPHP
jgi:hypothetical protein